MSESFERKLKEANEGNNAHAQYWVGMCYKYGLLEHTPPNPKLAKPFLTKASNTLAKACFELYMDCNPQEFHLHQGMSLLPSSNPPPWYMPRYFAKFHYDGEFRIGYDRDAIKAMDLLLPLATRELSPIGAMENVHIADAMYMMAHLYLEGRGVPQDFSQGMTWLMQSQALNYSHAMNCLGFIALERDVTEAMEWFLKSEKLGNSHAMLSGKCLFVWTGGWSAECGRGDGMVDEGGWIGQLECDGCD